MNRVILSLVLLIVFNIGNSQNIKIMVVTGGHSYDTLQFFEMYDRLNGIEFEHFSQPEANSLIGKEKVNNFDVLVFYDMWKIIDQSEKKAYLDLTKEGKPFLFLHHSIASYQDWTEFEKIIGGKYVEKGQGVNHSELSTYEHDVWVDYKSITKSSITKGLDTFCLFDEVYGNIKVSDKVIPLLQTEHPKSTKYVAWENRYNKSTIIYLQPGHDKRAYTDPKYKQLVLQSIKYLANKK